VRTAWLGIVLVLLPGWRAGAASDVASEEVVGLARSSNTFGLELYRRTKGPGNWCFSPASVALPLSLAWLGARGETAAQLGRVLRHSGPPARLVPAMGRLSRELDGIVTSGPFGEQSLEFEPDFVAALERSDAFLEGVDFKSAPEAARARVNGWIEERTRRRIRDLLPPNHVDADTRLLVVSAAYFKAAWAAPFEPSATRPEVFRVSRDTKKDVPTMHQTVRRPFEHADGLKALELSYAEGDLSMLLLLPDAPDGLEPLENTLTAERLDRIVRRLSDRHVTVSLPRFTVAPSDSSSLRDALAGMGMGLAFEAQRADFTGIVNPGTASDRVFLDDVLQRAFLRVDEEGTEAAGAAAMILGMGVEPPLMPAEFRADHPFLVVLRDRRSGLVVFLARIVDPSEN